jgi:lauroyl/myristoyl acyltransferase
VAPGSLSGFFQHPLNCALFRRCPPAVSRLYIQLLGKVYFARHPRERARYVTPLKEILGFRQTAASDFDGLAARVLRGIFDHYFEKLLNAYWGIERMRGMLLRDVEFVHEDLLAGALRGGGGVILNTAHFGALEFLPASLAFRGYPVAMMARFKTARLRDTIRRLAWEAGLELLDADDRRVLPKAISSLRRGSILIYQVDEISCWRPSHGKVMSFFGKRVRLDRTVELLQRRTGAALLLGLMERAGGGRYQLSFEVPSEHLPAPTGLGPDAQLIKRVEHYIYSFPEQWYNWKDLRLLDPLAI